MSKIIIHTQTPTKENLKNLYDVCNRLFKDEKLFYSKEEVQILKKDKNNLFLS